VPEEDVPGDQRRAGENGLACDHEAQVSLA
jgi:hypothetical protein